MRASRYCNRRKLTTLNASRSNEPKRHRQASANRDRRKEERRTLSSAVLQRRNPWYLSRHSRPKERDCTALPAFQGLLPLRPLIPPPEELRPAVLARPGEPAPCSWKPFPPLGPLDRRSADRIFLPGKTRT